MIKALFFRDMKLAFSRGNGLSVAIMFFFCVIVLISFSFNIRSDILAQIGTGIIWLGAVLSFLLGFDRLLLHDAEDGTLDIFLLHSNFFGLCLLLFVKAIAHWLGNVLPIIMAAPVLSILMNIDFSTSFSVFITLVIASPTITFIGLAAAALSVHLPRGNLLLAVIVLPLTIPIMIFAISSVHVTTHGVTILSTPLLLLCALSVFLAPICSFAGAAALKYL